MSLTSKYNTVLNRLTEVAKESPMTFQLAASIIKGKQPVSHLHANTYGTKCNGQLCGSIHAEAKALVDYYGDSLSFEGNKWCFLPRKDEKRRKG